MLLSIDRVLLLLSEGKSVEKIAEQAESDPQEVYTLLHEARRIIMEARPDFARKKVRLKPKKISNSDPGERIISDELLQHAELAVVPVEQPILIYIGVASDKEGHRYSLQLLDNEGKQFGKIVEFSVLRNLDIVWIQAALHAIRVALHFAASAITVRYDRDRLGDILTGRAVLDGKVAESAQTLAELIKKSGARFELIDRSANEKAYHLLTLKKENFDKQ